MTDAGTRPINAGEVHGSEFTASLADKVFFKMEYVHVGIMLYYFSTQNSQLSTVFLT